MSEIEKFTVTKEKKLAPSTFYERAYFHGGLREMDFASVSIHHHDDDNNEPQHKWYCEIERRDLMKNSLARVARVW